MSHRKRGGFPLHSMWGGGGVSLIIHCMVLHENITILNCFLPVGADDDLESHSISDVSLVPGFQPAAEFGEI